MNFYIILRLTRVQLMFINSKILVTHFINFVFKRVRSKSVKC